MVPGSVLSSSIGSEIRLIFVCVQPTEPSFNINTISASVQLIQTGNGDDYVGAAEFESSRRLNQVHLGKWNIPGAPKKIAVGIRLPLNQSDSGGVEPLPQSK